MEILCSPGTVGGSIGNSFMGPVKEIMANAIIYNNNRTRTQSSVPKWRQAGRQAGTPHSLNPDL